MAPRSTNFDALRLIAALMVIHGHGWELTGFESPSLWGIPFSRVGLDIFFSISGYLVTSSWERDAFFIRFASKRALRIWPGLICCVLITVLILGTSVTSLSLSEYTHSQTTIAYLANAIFLSELYLPGVFGGLADHGAVNGSLWSLFPEVICYLTVPLFSIFRPRLRSFALAIAAVLLGSAGLSMFYNPTLPTIVVYHADIRYILVTMPFFFIGGALALLSAGKSEAFWRADLCLLFFCGNYVITAWFGWWNIPFEWFTLPYMAVSFGRLSMPVLRRAARFGDLSYGMYLYAFPVQQLILVFLPNFAYPVLLCVVLTTPLAWLSWHLIERPAILLRSILKPTPLRSRAEAGR